MMPKPDWLVRRENKVPHKYKMCIDCKYVGEACGLTNNLGKGMGRMRMYECRKHPTVRLHFRTYACTDYEYGPTGAS